jgi:hypothetical protein
VPKSEDDQRQFTHESTTRMVIPLSGESGIDGARVLGRKYEPQITTDGILAKVYGNLENPNSNAMVHFGKETRNRISSSTYTILVTVDSTAIDSDLP